MESNALDTSPEAADFQLAVWRRLGPEGCVELAARLSDEIREVTLAGIRERHPEYSEAWKADLIIRKERPLSSGRSAPSAVRSSSAAAAP